MLICVEGGRKETTFSQKRKRERQKMGKKVCCGSSGGSSSSWRRRRKKNRVSDYAILPPPSWKHCVRALSLHILIMINAGSAVHTHTHRLKPRFWQGSTRGSPPSLWFCDGAVNTSPSGLVKVKNHKTGTKKSWSQDDDVLRGFSVLHRSNVSPCGASEVLIKAKSSAERRGKRNSGKVIL